jgi:hypothetical protein
MSIRTQRTTVSFVRPFAVIGLDDLQPAGTYTVETDEELIDGLSFPAYRRIATSIFLPAHPARPGWAEVAPIDPQELEDATRQSLAKAPIAQGEAGGREPSVAITDGGTDSEMKAE